MKVKTFNQTSATENLDNLLKKEAEKGKLNYLLVVKLEETKQVHVSGHGTKKTLEPLTNFINSFIKDY